MSDIYFQVANFHVELFDTTRLHELLRRLPRDHVVSFLRNKNFFSNFEKRLACALLDEVANLVKISKRKLRAQLTTQDRATDTDSLTVSLTVVKK